MGTDYTDEPPDPRRQDYSDEPRRRLDDDRDRRYRDDYPDDYGDRIRVPLAPRLSRLGAAFIDGFLMLLFMVPGFILIFTSVAAADPRALAANPFNVFQVAIVGGLVALAGGSRLRSGWHS